MSPLPPLAQFVAAQPKVRTTLINEEKPRLWWLRVFFEIVIFPCEVDKEPLFMSPAGSKAEGASVQSV